MMETVSQEIFFSKVLGRSFILTHAGSPQAADAGRPWLLLCGADGAVTRWQGSADDGGRLVTLLDIRDDGLLSNPLTGDFLTRELWSHMRRRHAVGDEPAFHRVVGVGAQAALPLLLLTQRRLIATSYVLYDPQLGAGRQLAPMALRLLREAPRRVTIELCLPQPPHDAEAAAAAEEFAVRARQQGWRLALSACK